MISRVVTVLLFSLEINSVHMFCHVWHRLLAYAVNSDWFSAQFALLCHTSGHRIKRPCYGYWTVSGHVNSACLAHDMSVDKLLTEIFGAYVVFHARPLSRVVMNYLLAETYSFQEVFFCGENACQ